MGRSATILSGDAKGHQGRLDLPAHGIMAFAGPGEGGDAYLTHFKPAVMSLGRSKPYEHRWSLHP